jgi:gamma-glutamyltranspeptidase/glutathione hydrolase
VAAAQVTAAILGSSARVTSPRKSLRSLLALVAVLVACAVVPARAQPGESAAAPGAQGRAVATGKRFMVAAANPHAVDAGHAILAKGGTAVDAAIAVQLVLGLVEPQSSGIGGGAFMLVHDARTRKLVAYDGRETAPSAATPERFLVNGKPLAFHDAVTSGLSTGVPGVVALLAETHRRHGKLPWATLFEPAIVIAERGFAVSPLLHRSIAADRYLDQPRAHAYFHDAQGRPLAVGTTLRNPAYAVTLRAIAERGANAFYEGAIAEDMVATANLHPARRGDMTLADLASYRVRVREPLCGSYRRFKVCGMPPPSSGGIATLQMLGMLERFPVGAMPAASFWSVHFVSEVGRLAFADRGIYVADPEFSPPPAGLLDRDYLAQRAGLIRIDASLKRAEPGAPPVRAAKPRIAGGAHEGPEPPSTTHLSIVDRYGNAVAMTSSIEDAFGNRRMTAGGFLLNNQLTDFSFVPLADGKPVANRVEGGKRPRSSMAPTIVYDAKGRVFMVAGSMGGPTIINQVVKNLVAVIDWNLDPRAAVALPNFGSRNGPTELEKGTTVVDLASKLEALGHDTTLAESRGGAHLVVRTPTGWSGGADPRREGVARGD